MQLTPGDKLGPYEVTGLIGKGGMGEVYRATDPRLHRSVALKVSNREFNDRFEREAHAIAALNHPHICTLYDVGPNYLVMEFVEGDLLSKIIERGPLPLDKALAYATQIADALAAAHAKGIVHRDLKPGNIIITSNGAKVLDFGLAKLAIELPSGTTSNVETATAPLTQAGAILGTLFYMAPEQVEGKEATDRSDIFAFGIILYEMITGQRPFTGDTQAAVLAAILKDQPAPMNARQPATPRSLERIVRRCLEKKPDDRWHTARELKAALEMIDLDAPPVSGTTTNTIPITSATPAPASNKWLMPVLAVVALAALGLAGWTFLKPAAPQQSTRFEVELPADVQFNEYVSVSPDGRKLLFTAIGDKQGLWIRDLDTLEWRRLPGTETGPAVGPAWSPDGKYIAYSTLEELKKVDLAGGPPITLCKTPGFPIGTSAWTLDGSTLAFGGRGQGALYRVSSGGGIAQALTVLDTVHGERFNALPYFLPDGKHFLYLRGGTEEIRGLYVGSLDTKPEDQSKNPRILPSSTNIPYVNGKLFFVRDGTLMAQNFDADKFALTGDPFPIAEHIGGTNSTSMFSVSPAGTLAYRQIASQQQGAPSNRITAWYDRAGKQTSRLEVQNQDREFFLSPDARRAVSSGRTEQNLADGLWIDDFARGVRTRLTFQQSGAAYPVWSPDGARTYYTVGNEIYQKDANGAGDARKLFQTSSPQVRASSVSSDGRFLLYTFGSQGDGADLGLLPLQGDPKPVTLLQTQASDVLGVFSPDGRWIAYYSNESSPTRYELYVRPLIAGGPTGPTIGEGKWQISHNGASTGEPPVWTKNGREIVFRVNGEFHAAAIGVTSSVLQPGQETTLFSLTLDSWDVTADGGRFLITSSANAVSSGAAQGPQAPITVVLNWEAGLKK